MAVGLVSMLGSWLNVDLVILDMWLCGGRMVEVGNVIVIDIEVFWMRCKISHHRKYKGNSGEFF